MRALPHLPVPKDNHSSFQRGSRTRLGVTERGLHCIQYKWMKSGGIHILSLKDSHQNGEFPEKVYGFKRGKCHLSVNSRWRNGSFHGCGLSTCTWPHRVRGGSAGPPPALPDALP